MKGLTFILVLMIMISCNNVMTIDVPMRPPKLTLNAIFNPDSVWTASLSLDRYILDNDINLVFEKVDDALVIIYQDNKPVDTLAWKATDYNFEANYRSISGKPMNTNPYEIRATSPRHGSVRASSQLPLPIAIDDVKGDTLSFASWSGPLITVSFKDRAHEPNYFYLYIIRDYKYYNPIKKDTVKSQEYLSLSSTDPILQNNSKSAEDFYTNDNTSSGFLFSDALFDGKAVSLQFSMPSYYPHRKDKINVYLKTLSKNLYDYISTNNLQDVSSSDPFAQPTFVYSNIENGVGIFAGYSESVYHFTY